ncbi:MAG: SpoIIE family protein phosphatase [Burkholderiales bacterium]|nr:SpoIIE family protein phosphatase [Bacteroidia bacterium]
MLKTNHLFNLNYFKCLNLTILLFAFGCQNNNSQQTNVLRSTESKGIIARGYVVPKDSLSPPVVFKINQSKLKKVTSGKPTINITNTNVHDVNTEIKNFVVIPRIIIPGTDTFLLPKTILAIDSSFLGGIPEVVIAKDAAVKDVNPDGFSSFGKLQGLKHGTVNYLMEDKKGNLWIATNGGGVSKFDGNSFMHYTEKEGLSNNSVWCTLEDQKGNIWFGTSGSGVTKFDGKLFTHYTEKEGMSNNVVFSILEDKHGNIWFGTNGGGVTKYDGKTFTYYTDKQGLVNNYVLSIMEDHLGNLWFGTNGGISKFNGKAFENYEDLPNNEIFSILEVKNGDIWFATYGAGALKFNGKTFTNFTDKEGLPNNEILSIKQDKHNNIWFGTNGNGVSKYDGKTFTNFSGEQGLPNNIVKSIVEDKSGNLWFSTHGSGVSKYSGNLFSHFMENEGLSNNIVFSFLQDKTGNIWLSNYGTGISQYDGKSFTHFSENEGLPNGMVWSSLKDKTGNLWFATGAGLCKYDGITFTHFTDADGLANNDVRDIYEDRAGNLWFATNGGGVSKYDGNIKSPASFTNFSVKEGMSNTDVRTILEDRAGNFWFGTYGGGITRYDGKVFTHFKEEDGLGNNIVMSMLEDSSGNIWFGTYGGGVTMFDGKSFINITEKEGLSSNVVMSLLEDKSGNLWFGTRFGLSKLSKSKIDGLIQKVSTSTFKEDDVFFKVFAYEDGFTGIGCFTNSIYEANDGAIWIGTNDRLTVYHPEGEMTDTLAPNIQLTGLELYNETISWLNLENHKDTILTLGNGVNINHFKFNSVSRWNHLPINLSLDYDNNYLTFNFVGITQKQSKKVKYQYKLEGIDANWSAITNRTSAPYGNLPHGTYRFKVKAMSSAGYWSKEVEYEFVIRPPFWHTWWFRCLMVLIISGSIYLFIKRRERKLRLLQKELESKIEIATEDIKQQKHIIEEHQKETIDSINYAKRIQFALLANAELLRSHLNNHFVLFKPKDIVSGDFYWATEYNNKFYLAVCDSTGHGVPGAFMSLLNMGFLSEAIKEKNISEPHEILNYVRTRLIDSIGNDGQQDGMDAVLMCFEKNSKKLCYAAANNYPVLIRNNQIEILPKDKMPVGKGERTDSFSKQTIELIENDVVYVYTDGYADQFGGPKGKKLKYKQLNELLLSISDRQLSEQSDVLNKTIENWRGNLEQVDDILVLGFKV